MRTRCLITSWLLAVCCLASWQPAPALAGEAVTRGLLGREVTAGREHEGPFQRLPDPGDGAWFAETGHTLRHGFRAAWEKHGGLPRFGYPISAEFQEVSPTDGQVYTVQYFERARFEYHPEHAGTPYEVLLGHLGRQVSAGRQAEAVFQPRTDPGDGSWLAATGHSVRGAFWRLWQVEGLEVLGYPISEEFQEVNAATGHTTVVQYFERARLERSRSGDEVSAQIAPVSEQELLTRLNAARSQAGVPALTVAPAVNALAGERAADMATRQYFAHYTPEGKSALDLIAARGIDYRYAGETIQRNNFPSEQATAEAMRSLLDSPAHRALLLEGRFRHVGIGHAVDGAMHYYAVILIEP